MPSDVKTRGEWPRHRRPARPPRDTGCGGTTSQSLTTDRRRQWVLLTEIPARKRPLGGDAQQTRSTLRYRFYAEARRS
jgi:hypothetical protein